MKTNDSTSPRVPYTGTLERGPDQSYNGRAIRLDLTGMGGAIHLGYEGNYMADAPDAYVDHILTAVNGRASDQARIEMLTKALDEVESWLDGDRESAKHGEDMTEVDLDTILARLNAVQTALKGSS